jgi:hypothetical protein
MSKAASNKRVPKCGAQETPAAHSRRAVRVCVTGAPRDMPTDYGRKVSPLGPPSVRRVVVALERETLGAGGSALAHTPSST